MLDDVVLDDVVDVVVELVVLVDVVVDDVVVVSTVVVGAIAGVAKLSEPAADRLAQPAVKTSTPAITTTGFTRTPSR